MSRATSTHALIVVNPCHATPTDKLVSVCMGDCGTSRVARIDETLYA